jgi:serine/threonine-protein kinase
MTQGCQNCGALNAPGARFCHRCGWQLAGSTYAQPVPAQPAAAIPGTGLLPPQSLLANRYIVLRRVGQGGMGAVYEAADNRIPGKTWAVKEMSDAALTNPLEKQQAIEGFRREAQLLSQLDHPNIPKVTDYFSEGGKQYLVMEFVTGETLQKKLERQGGPLPEAEVRRWAEQLCDVLDYLHRQQPPVIFRDLKPANIMVDGMGKVKLIDFGIVRFFQPGKVTDTTSFGTAGYAPPEQYGKGQTDARSDLYALGATLHQLLTGRDPALMPFQFQSVRSLNPGVSAAAEQVILRAQEHHRDRRWPNARAMQQALQASGWTPTAAPYGGAVAVSAPAAQAPYMPQPAYGTPAQSASQPGYGAPAAPPSGPSTGWGSTRAPWPASDMAGFGRRAAAFLIDSVLLYGVAFVLLAPFAALAGSDAVALLQCAGFLAALCVQVWYFVFYQARSGQTLGKKWLGIKVISADGGPLTRGRYFARYFGYALDSLIFYIGWLMPLWDPDQQALHDKVARTFVVRA